MTEVIKCCIYTITLLLYTSIKFTGIVLIRDRNGLNYIYIRTINQNSHDLAILDPFATFNLGIFISQSDHFGSPKNTCNDISRHFRTICNF